MRGLLLAALVEAGIISWRDLSKDAMLPLPSDYVAVAIYFGGLSLLPESASTFTSLMGWGMVLATFLGLFDPTNPTKLVFFGQSNQAQQAQSLGSSGAFGANTTNTTPASSAAQGQLNPAGTPLGGQNAAAPTYTGTNFS